MFTRVVVPLDGSKFAEAALPVAAAVVRGSGAALELFSAHEPVPPPAVSGAEAASMTVPTHTDALGAIPVTTTGMLKGLRDERTTYLHDVARRLRDDASLDPEVTLLDGRADQAIMERVQEKSADLVVMATHGRGPMERAWLGSVADRVARESPVPVLLVRPANAEAPDLSVAADIHRVVVALDGSTLSEAVLEPATLLARALSVPILVIRAVNVRADLGSTYLPHAAQAYHEQIEGRREEAAEYVRAISADLSSRGVEVAGAEAVDGSAPRTILDTADPDGRDVIAMATHGRGGFRRLVLGSVSDKVVRAAVGPVLLVRPTEHQE